MTAHEEQVAALVDALAELHANQLPAHLADQLTAAAREAYELTKAIGEAGAALEPDKWTRTPRTGQNRAAALEASARVILAMRSARMCPHLRDGGPQPATARLALHRVDCRRCLATRRRPPAAEADRCDWCGTRGVTVFQPIVLSTGPVLAIGDACPTCGNALRALVPEEAHP